MRYLNDNLDRQLFSDQPRYVRATSGDDPGNGLEFVGWLVFVVLMASFNCLLLLLSHCLPDSTGE